MKIENLKRGQAILDLINVITKIRDSAAATESGVTLSDNSDTVIRFRDAKNCRTAFIHKAFGAGINSEYFEVDSIIAEEIGDAMLQIAKKLDKKITKLEKEFESL